MVIQIGQRGFPCGVSEYHSQIFRKSKSNLLQRGNPNSQPIFPAKGGGVQRMEGGRYFEALR